MLSNVLTHYPAVDLAMQRAPVEAAPPSETVRLTRAMQRGDEEAYREFFHLYFHRLLAYLLVVTRGQESLARDLVQQTMIKVAKHIRPFADEETLWRWLTLLARTAAMDEGRKSQRYFGFLERFWQNRSFPSNEIDTPGVEENAFAELFTKEFEELDPDDRLILEKKYLEGLSVKSIAAELNITEKAVESRLTRARAKLKQTLVQKLRHE